MSSGQCSDVILSFIDAAVARIFVVCFFACSFPIHLPHTFKLSFLVVTVVVVVVVVGFSTYTARNIIPLPLFYHRSFPPPIFTFMEYCNKRILNQGLISDYSIQYNRRIVTLHFVLLSYICLAFHFVLIQNPFCVLLVGFGCFCCKRM